MPSNINTPFALTQNCINYMIQDILTGNLGYADLDISIFELNEPKMDLEYILNGTGSVLDYLGAKQDKNEPDGERVIRIFPDRTSKFSFRKR